MSYATKTRMLPLALVLITVALGATSTFAGASRDGATLTVNGTENSDDIRIDAVRNRTGLNTVTVYGAPGPPDGMLFVGIQRTEINTYTESDTVELDIESETIQVEVVNTTQPLTAKVRMRTPMGIEDVSANFRFDTGTGSDSIEIEIDNSADNLDVSTNFNLGTRAGTVKVDVENLTPVYSRLNFTGVGGIGDDTFELTASGPGAFEINGEVRVDEAKVNIEGNVYNNFTVRGESPEAKAETVVKGNMGGSPGYVGLATGTATIEGDSADFRFSNVQECEYIVKGNLIGSPQIQCQVAKVAIDGVVVGTPSVSAQKCDIQPQGSSITTNGCERR